jgi:sirohydrochlorin cobaltochelatase
MRSAVVLLGHGSHISPNTAGVVWAVVDALRARGLADEITAGFWKEQPAFSRVLSTVRADRLALVPMFTAQGYFTRQVIPSEIGLSKLSAPPLMTRTLGEHPAVSGIVQARARDAVAAYDLRPEQTAIALIGHGTRSSPTSRAATEAQAAALRTLGLAREVVAVYLDDDPDIPTVYHTTEAPVIVAIPYFLAAGSHTTQDVPEALGLPDGQTEAVIAGRRVIYTPPLGRTDGELADLVADLLAEAGWDVPPRPPESVWDGFPTVGHEELLQALKAQGQLTFGALTVTADEVRCAPPDAPSTELPVLTTPAQVRAACRTSPFRPWACARAMPNRWRVRLSRPQDVPAVIETVYPGLLADWAAQRRGSLAVVSLRAVIGRQKGMFRALEALTAQAEQALRDEVCGGCILTPRWGGGDVGGDGLPCAEPCNLYLSAAREGETGQ